MGGLLRLVGNCVAGPTPWLGLLAVVTLGLGGCESVLRGPGDRLQLTTTPSGAEVKASSGEACLTPCTLTFDRGDFTVVISKRGFKTERFAAVANCAGAVDIALRPNASITAYELPDRDLPLIAGCERLSSGRPQPTGLLAPPQPAGLPPAPQRIGLPPIH